jgi:hypothetical protein
MLADRDSSALHLSLAHRHQRLARRYNQETMAETIQAAMTALETRSAATDARELDRQAAYDGVQATDADLDNAVRNLFNDAENFDRANVGAGVVVKLFPEGGFTPVTSLEISKELSAVEGLATRVEALGAQHALKAHAATLRTRAQEVRTAITAMENAIRARAAALAEEEIAQAALRRQYEGNYLDARRSLGRAQAERLFPSVNNPKTGDADEEGQTVVPKPA